MIQFPENLYADLRLEDVTQTAIIFENGILRQNKESRKKGAFLRVYDGKRWYYCATTDLNRLQAEMDSLAAMATPNPDIGNDPVVRRFQVNRDTVLRYQAQDLRAVPNADKLALLRGYLPVLEAMPEITVSRCRYLDMYTQWEFYSSLGASICYDDQQCGLAFGYTLAAGKNPFRNMQTFFATRFDGLDQRREELRNAVAADLDYAKNAVPVEPGVYTCVLTPEVTGVFAHESFGHKSESDFMLGSETMRREWALGTKVGWDKLSIMDSGLPEGSGYVPYDDEGTKTEETYLIRNGVLTGRLHSASTAAALDEAVTGNARAINFEFEPIVRMTSTYVAPGTDSLESLLAGAEGGLYIPDYFHGSGMSTFTIAPARAYRIRDGKIAEPVLVSVISGNVMETLHKIDGASREFELCSKVTGGCGKMEQFPLRVAFGGPYLRVRDMNVQ